MAKTNKITNLSVIKSKIKENSKVSALSPREIVSELDRYVICLLYTSPSPRDGLLSRMPSSA